MGELGQMIRSAREKKKMSLRALEKIVGVSNAHLSQVETGAIERPSMALLFSISEALDLSYDDLLTAAGYTEPASGGPTVAAAALHGIDELTPDEQEEVAKFIELMKRRRASP